MIQRISPWLFLAFAVIDALGQHEQTRENFFSHVKNFEFTQAQDEIEGVTDSSWKEALSLFQRVLYHAGQQGPSTLGEDSVTIAQLESRFSEGSSGQVILKLLWGYYYFYTNPYTERPIKYFSDAYLLSKEVGTSEEVKFCVYSILKLYNWELSQSNDDLLEYLKIYEGLVEDNADEFHFKMSRFLFELRDINYDINVSDQFVETFRNLMESFPEDHHFWTEYYITLGVYKRHFGTISDNPELVDEAQQLFTGALLRMGDEPYLRYLKFRVYIQLSEIARARRDFDGAINYISKAKAYSYLNDPTRADYYISRYAAPSLYGRGEADSAFYVLSAADTLRNRLDYQINSLRIAQYQWKFQTEEKERDLIKTRNWLLTVLAALVFLSVVYILLQLNSRKKRLLAIQDKNMQAQKVTSLLKEQELIALNSMIEGQEKERKRIAEDLHDRLGSTLAGLKMHMEVLLDKDPKFSKLKLIVNQAVNDTREIAHNMLSGVLTKFGLMAALRDLKWTIEAANQFEIRLQSIQFDERLDSEIELHIYRIVQELISNTLKHAKASSVDVELRKTEDNRLIITYKDDGVGFDTQSSKEGMGLKNIESRVRNIEGTWTITSAPMQGVTVVIELENIES